MYNERDIRVALHITLALRLNVSDSLTADGVYGRFAFIDSLVHTFIITFRAFETIVFATRAFISSAKGLVDKYILILRVKISARAFNYKSLEKRRGMEEVLIW